MVIEESILIKADIKKTWKTFTDLTCWAEWNTVACNAVSDSGLLEKGERFTFSLQPFSVPITLKTTIEEVVPAQRVVWSGSKFGIFSRHEFLFQQIDDSVLVMSSETFHGLPLLFGAKHLTESTVSKLTIAMLNDLKKACERGKT
jgi:hypothetical protein